jgi:hypothetical protein
MGALRPSRTISKLQLTSLPPSLLFYHALEGMQSLIKLAQPYWAQVTPYVAMLAPVTERVNSLWASGVELAQPHLHHVEPIREFALQGWQQVCAPVKICIAEN